MENLHTIEIKFMSPTNTRGARVKLYSHRFKSLRIINYDYELNGALMVAACWLEAHGVICDFMSESSGAGFIHTKTFVDIKGL